MSEHSGFWRDRPVAVTGASGFLGSHLTATLVERGAEVVVLERDTFRSTPITEGWRSLVTVVRGDVVDQAVMERLLGEHRVATVFHLAAQAQVGVANRNPVSTFESNIKGTWTVLEAARRSPGVEQVLVASSDKAYGAQPVLPYTEDMPLLGVNPYDVSKSCADLLTSSYVSTYSLPACIARCGNFFGPGDTNWDRIVPGTIRSLLRGERPVIRSDGTPTRDYIHVEDGVLAYLDLAEAMAAREGVVGEAFNFSTETPMSAREVVDVIREVAGRTDLEPVVLGEAAHEIDHQYLSSEKARRLLEWKPRWTMREALADTVAWYRRVL